MSERTIVLARHGLAGSNTSGTTSGVAPGEGLTEEGVAQARRLGEALAEEEVEVGIVTRFRRTQETLAHALDGREIPVEIVPELDEIDFGSFGGGPLEAYRAWAASEPPTTPAPGGGESRAAVAARFALGLRRVLERPERSILVVGHALFIRYALDAAAGLVPAARMAPVEHAVPYRVCVRDAEAAADLLEAWSRAPRFRPPPNEGRGRA